MPILNPSEISKAQQEDPTLNEIWRALKQSNTNQIKSINPTKSLLLREFESLKLQEDEQTLPSQFGELSLLFMNLFLHPFIFVMSLVFPVREIKGIPSSVKDTYCVSL